MKETTFHLRDHLLFALLTVLTLILCIGVGSVSVPFRDTAEIIFRAIAGWEQPSGSAVAIILYTRLPRVLCVALVGAMLALGGCAMQGLLRNPLARRWAGVRARRSARHSRFSAACPARSCPSAARRARQCSPRSSPSSSSSPSPSLLTIPSPPTR